MDNEQGNGNSPAQPAAPPDGRGTGVPTHEGPAAHLEATQARWSRVAEGSQLADSVPRPEQNPVEWVDSSQAIPTVELPKGGGDIRGMGETIEARAFTGSFGVTIPIVSSPGRGGFGPQLALSYASGAGTGPFGLGWMADVPSVSRRTDRGVPVYNDGPKGDTFMFGGTELVPVRNASVPRWGRLKWGTFKWGRGNTYKQRTADVRDGHYVEAFRPRHERDYTRIERWRNTTTGEVHWRTISAANVTSFYGQTSASRIADPDDTSKVFRWLIDEQRDDRGNLIRYEYKAEDAAGVNQTLTAEAHRFQNGPGPIAQRYLKRIKYGNKTVFDAGTNPNPDFHFEIVFDYGEHGSEVNNQLDISPAEDRDWSVRPDATSSYRSGFELRTYRRCERVLMFHDFADLGNDPVLVAATEFTYDADAERSLMTSVKEVRYQLDGGTGNYDDADFPGMSFGYTQAQVADAAIDADPSALENVVADGGAGSGPLAFRFVDLDGDGLPGILSENAGQWFYKPGLGQGRFGAARVLPQMPSGASLAAGYSLEDLDGGGAKHLVAYAGPRPGYYDRQRDADASWSQFRPFAELPEIDWNDPSLQRIDLNGDGFADVLITTDQHMVWYPSRGKEGFEPGRYLPRPRDEREGPTQIYGDATTGLFLADMSGDGMTDLVRVRSGSVCYWPNFGHGRFGRQITMQDAPVLDRPDQFDSARVRLVDVEGTGPADLIYQGGDGVRIWRNHAGNGYTPSAQHIVGVPAHDSGTRVELVDMLGNGSACLAWAHSYGAQGSQLRYLPLNTGTKPWLLASVDNNRGLQTSCEYTPSTVASVADRLAGKPWATRLPFPVWTVSRVEAYDQIAGRKFVQRYAYHHGYFDVIEREFRGFARVDRWDTEGFDDFWTTSGQGETLILEGQTLESELHQPPIHTKTWFLTGAFERPDVLMARLGDEFWTDDPVAEQLPVPSWPAKLKPSEAREATQILAGETIRSEVYALDGHDDEAKPYVVSQSQVAVECLQRRGGNKRAVFRVIPKQSLSLSSERTLDDARVGQQVVLEVDDYGAVLRSCALAYPRRGTGHPTEQTAFHVTLTERDVVHMTSDVAQLRLGLEVESRLFEVHNLGAPSGGTVWSWDEVKTNVEAVTTTIDYDGDPNPPGPPDPDPPVLRRLDWLRTRYYKDDLSGFEAQGTGAYRGIIYDVKRAALTTGQVSTVYGSNVTSTDLQNAGYELADSHWWTTSGLVSYDASKFYAPTVVADPFGNETNVSYDTTSMFAVQIESVIDVSTSLIVAAEIDYRVLAPWRMTDPNGSRSEVAFDIRGMVTDTAIRGRATESLGDTLADPTSRFEYELFEWANNQKPNYARSFVRETHADSQTRWFESVSYVDGAGTVILNKVQAAPGLAPERDGNGDLVFVGGVLQYADTSPDPRWIGNGRTLFDNKGNPVKQYEPYFSSTDAYEDESELVEQGVTPRFHYDPLGRAIRVDLPNGSFSSVTFTPWEEKSYDANDNVKASDWYANNAPAGSPNTPLEQAAVQTESHDDTPATKHFDVLGRPFQADACVERLEGPPVTYTVYSTKSELDIEGNVLKVIDARNNTAEERTYGMLGQVLEVTSVDAGTRTKFVDVTGVTQKIWDSRSHTHRFVYDVLRRPIERYVHDGTTERLREKILYGEGSGASARAEGRVIRVYDGGGELKVPSYDFRGRIPSETRTLPASRTTQPDWSALAGLTTEAAIDGALGTLLESSGYTTARNFDALSRVTDATSPDSSKLEYAYDQGMQLESVDLFHRGASTSTQVVSGLTYDAKGQREQVTYANGTTTTYTYDPETFRITRIYTEKTSTSTVVQDLNYTYDPVGNITNVEDNAQATIYFSNNQVTPDRTYEYDPLYRLIEATGREHLNYARPGNGDVTPLTAIPDPNNPQALTRYTETYEYDEVGNILKLVHSASAGTGNWTRRYNHDTAGNRLHSTSIPAETTAPTYTSSSSPQYSDTYGYDAHGNMTSMPGLSSLVWNDGDELLSAPAGSGTVYFQYAGGQRIRKYEETTGSTTKERIYIGGWEVFRERSNGTTISEEIETLHVHDDVERVLMVEEKTVGTGTGTYWRYQLSNHLGSASAELDSSGNVFSYEEFHPFGTSAYRAHDSTYAASPRRYRFTSMERDSETGLAYHGARYYAPWLGRWTAADPIRLGDGVNRFRYSHNNPIRLVDPLGTFAGEGPWTTSYSEVSSSETGGVRTETGLYGESRVGGPGVNAGPAGAHGGGRGTSKPTGPDWSQTTPDDYQAESTVPYGSSEMPEVDMTPGDQLMTPNPLAAPWPTVLDLPQPELNPSRQQYLTEEGSFTAEQLAAQERLELIEAEGAVLTGFFPGAFWYGTSNRDDLSLAEAEFLATVGDLGGGGPSKPPKRLAHSKKGPRRRRRRPARSTRQARPGTALPAGTLTPQEVAEVEAIAKKYGTTIDVVGSRAAGRGRNIDTDLRVGKDRPGDPSRSDIDFRIDTKHPDVEQIMAELRRVGRGAGNASRRHGTDHRPTQEPFIRISPRGTTYHGQ